LNRSERLAKRLIDVVVAGAAVVVLAPLLLLTMLAIKLDGPGPVIFRQRRCGFDGREFVNPDEDDDLIPTFLRREPIGAPP